MAELIHGVPPEFLWRFVSFKKAIKLIRCYEKLLVESRYPGARVRSRDILTLRASTGELNETLFNLIGWMPEGKIRDQVVHLMDDVSELLHNLDYLPVEFEIGGRRRAEGTLVSIKYHTKHIRIGLRSQYFSEVRYHFRLMRIIEKLLCT